MGEVRPEKLLILLAGIILISFVFLAVSAQDQSKTELGQVIIFNQQVAFWILNAPKSVFFLNEELLFPVNIRATIKEIALSGMDEEREGINLSVLLEKGEVLIFSVHLSKDQPRFNLRGRIQAEEKIDRIAASSRRVFLHVGDRILIFDIIDANKIREIQFSEDILGIWGFQRRLLIQVANRIVLFDEDGKEISAQTLAAPPEKIVIFDQGVAIQQGEDNVLILDHDGAQLGSIRAIDRIENMAALGQRISFMVLNEIQIWNLQGVLLQRIELEEEEQVVRLAISERRIYAQQGLDILLFDPETGSQILRIEGEREIEFLKGFDRRLFVIKRVNTNTLEFLFFNEEGRLVKGLELAFKLP